MALIKPIHASQISGSLAGTTFSHNAGGMYMRSRTIPTDPNSGKQQLVRNAMTQCSTAWVETLTEVQRQAWTTYGANVPIINRLGDPIILSGIAQYVRSNVLRLFEGFPRVDAAPTIFNIGSFSDPTFALDEPNDEVDVSFINTDDWANEDDSNMVVFASPPQNQSVNYYKGPYRIAGEIEGDAITPPTSPAAISLPWPITTGQRVFFRVSVTRADGRLSASFRDRADS